ncbi:MAG: glutamate--tRNA ligase [Hyphomicrobiales bacterium]|nr:glutamate--tRNA ligase [Hyphomicrobiales bacterium]
MTVVTRFAPSPTGDLHIGAARTALFNWLYARHHGGRFLLRIEDTDRVRSTEAAVQAILDGLDWLGLNPDEEPVFQYARADRHVEAARGLLEQGQAYRCYATPDELDEMRQSARAKGQTTKYDGRWRDRNPDEAPPGIQPVIRFKAPQTGETTITDLVQGPVTVANDQLDDMVLVRADGTPTFMLSCVVDDHDMGISHVIRGDDHLNNSFRQYQLYAAFGWTVPQFAHIPLIHGADGQKLSKRHGAMGVEGYRAQGFLPEAVCNYLLRLGWSHGDDEIIDRDQAISWFDLDQVGRSPARFDSDKLLNLNGHYLRHAESRQLVTRVLSTLSNDSQGALSENAAERISRGISSLQERAKTYVELCNSARFYVIDGQVPIDEAARALLTPEALKRLVALAPKLRDLTPWQADGIEAGFRDVCSAHGWKLRDLAQPVRAALTGSKVSPPIFEVMDILGRKETLTRLTAAVEQHSPA